MRWEIPSYRLEDVALRVADRIVVLPDVGVSTEPIWRSNVVECVLGRDVLDSRGGYTLNFRTMSALLE